MLNDYIQYESPHKIANKIQLLKQPVYPPIRNNKKINKIYNQKYSPPLLLKVCKNKNQIILSDRYSLPVNQIINDEPQNCDFSPNQKVKNHQNNNSDLQTLNIEFQHKFRKLNSTNNLRTVNQSFRPSQTNFHLRKVVGKSGQRQSALKIISLKQHLTQPKSNSRYRDSQSLLRKNSLYLLNFLKTRYKDKNTQLKPQDMPFLTQLQMKKLQQKEYYQKYYQHYRKNVAALKPKQAQNYQIKTTNKRQPKPLIPQPW